LAHSFASGLSVEPTGRACHANSNSTSGSAARHEALRRRMRGRRQASPPDDMAWRAPARAAARPFSAGSAHKALRPFASFAAISEYKGETLEAFFPL
jgi:hypothetical protein